MEINLNKKKFLIVPSFSKPTTGEPAFCTAFQIMRKHGLKDEECIILNPNMTAGTIKDLKSKLISVNARISVKELDNLIDQRKSLSAAI